MDRQNLEAHAGGSVEIDVCRSCRAFWFDSRESLQLAPASTLRLFSLIAETAAGHGRTPLSPALRCPRCRGPLRVSHDLQRSTPFRYWRCEHGHGRFITFFDFLREKDFVRPLSQGRIDELRKHTQSINCSNCGAPVDVSKTSACAHCGTPLSMIDVEHAQSVVALLKRAAEPRPIDPALPIELARARREVDAAFAEGTGAWTDGGVGITVEAALSALMGWLGHTKS